jgi:diguanylate cyclase (GGDEF)-like protein
VRCTLGGLEAVSLREVSDFAENGTRTAPDEGAPLHKFPLLAKAVNSGVLCIETRKKGIALIWPVKRKGTGSVSGVVVAEIDSLPEIEQIDAVTRFLNFFGNYIGLLDYSELDTLTGLNNRKTYDESFDRLLSSIPSVAGAAKEMERRHSPAEQEHYWLGEVDIDHFKRINDNFGHLFGDEVLLRLANLMRHCFRATDAIYRFGGEEFVVVLRSTSKTNAQLVFDRFRNMVESYEFPQVGKVTCSVGYSRVDPSLMAADILGQADAALYFSKENGRNQINCYGDLIEQGLLTPQSVMTPQLDADIDALFG